MPVACPIEFPKIGEDTMRSLDYKVMGHAFATHKVLGCLCDESVYKPHIAARLLKAGFYVDREVPVRLTFRDFTKVLFLDLVVDQSVIYEFKTVTHLTKAHEAQLLNYLFVTNASRGKLVNSRPTSVESRFVNSAVDYVERRRFRVDESAFTGPDDFREMMTELVADWGTGLNAWLYTQALVHCLGGEYVAICQLPMQVEGMPAGNQRFHLINKYEAFRITTFQCELSETHVSHLRRLLAPSPLTQLVWVNIGREQLTLRSLGK